MTKFSLDLPFFVSLAQEQHAVNVNGRRFTISHESIEQEVKDPRLGQFAGSFGFVRDQLGLLRFSKLTAELDTDDLAFLRRTLFGGSFSSPSTWSPQTKGQVALALFNHFLNRYRAATHNHDIRPIRQWDLASLYIDDERLNAQLRLYGGSVTLPVVDLSPERHERVVNRLASPDAPAAFELSALDALRAIDDGMENGALVIAAGALESAIDTYLMRSWRLKQPRVLPLGAAQQLEVGGKDIRTIDDVLEKGAISAKLRCDPITALVVNAQLGDSLGNALELRNLAVHGGVQVPSTKARRAVETMTGFVLDHLTPAIQRDCPHLPRSEVLYAYEEAMGKTAPTEIEGLVATYLDGAGLSAKLYNRKAVRQNMYSERYGDTLVMRIAIGDFQAQQVDLFLGRALLNHWLELQGNVAFARVAASLPDENTRMYWSVVASEMTRAVWLAAIDRRLESLGLGDAVHQETRRLAGELKQKYGRSYVDPAFEQLEYWVGYLGLARIAAALPDVDSNHLLRTSADTAPQVTDRARRAMAVLKTVDFEDSTSILDALIVVHDAHEGILATVPIYDPATDKEYGLGLKFEDLEKIVESF